MDVLSRFNGVDFDVRKSGSARFMDQKVTPDVLCVVAECILEFVKSGEKEFAVKDIWKSEYAGSVVDAYFGKPNVVHDSATHEYDKFFSQPIKTLAYAGILESKKESNKYSYSVKDFELLNFIAVKEKNAYVFLTIYLEKVLKDSGMWDIFVNFFDKQDKSSFKELKENYEDFIIENTNINGKIEARRHFTKVLNPLSHKNNSKGTEKGNLSGDKIQYSDLFYNRPNFRDIGGGKQKGETRSDYVDRLGENQSNDERIRELNLRRAKKKIREYHDGVSEVSDEHANAEATHVHHIFPQNEFPDLDSILENLILLTPTQHLNRAHLSGNTQYVDRDYQLVCLLAKSSSVEKSVEKDDGFYSKEDFVFVINTGLSPESGLESSLSFGEVRNRLSSLY